MEGTKSVRAEGVLARQAGPRQGNRHDSRFHVEVPRFVRTRHGYGAATRDSQGTYRSPAVQVARERRSAAEASGNRLKARIIVIGCQSSRDWVQGYAYLVILDSRRFRHTPVDFEHACGRFWCILLWPLWLGPGTSAK